MARSHTHLETRPRQTPTKRLLLLDDDSAVRKTLVLIGTKLGAEVSACANLAEFQHALKSFDPDILLIDLMMPDADGIDAISAIGPQCGAAIYVITGADKRTLEASRDVLLRSGARISGFVSKPFSVSDLQKVIEGTQLNLACGQARLPDQGEPKLLSPSAFARAVRGGEVEPHFQPIIDASCMRLKGFEALLRVKGERTSSFAQQYLSQLVGDNGLASEVTNIVIEKSLRFLSQLKHAPDLTVSLNIFGAQVIADGFREQLVQCCSQFGIDRTRVILELSEATVFELSDQDLRKVTQLRLAGFGLSIDDFGTGNSSLSRLAKLPFSELKIDKAFCGALPHSTPAKAVIEACLGLARKLDMAITAEGVESLDVAVMLAEMGCTALQGHYFGTAQPPHIAARTLLKPYCLAVA